MPQRIFSGVQPSGKLHIGNYLGAIKNWVNLQADYDCVFCVVDLHAITVPQDPKELQKKTIEVAKIYLAAGIDPDKSSIFIQSHIPQHAELAWILNTITKNGDLTKMTQFKDKAGFDEDVFLETMTKKADMSVNDILEKRGVEINKSIVGDEILKLANSIQNFSVLATLGVYKKFIKERFNSSSVGLFDYPVLMAADILLYSTDMVPVGKDQLQHIELTRTLAERFNKKFGETFVIPKAHITEQGQNIMGLDDPSKKMSKSASSEYNYIALTDSEDDVRRKIKKAVTDSGSDIVYSDDKPALQNLINIYSLFSEKSTREIAEMYQGKGYAQFKDSLVEVIISFLKPFQQKMAAYSDEAVLAILKAGAEKVRPLASQKMAEIKQKIGFIN